MHATVVQSPDVEPEPTDVSISISTTMLVPHEPAIDLVRIISERTYASFAQSLKEFVSDAYDAGAGRLDITIVAVVERIRIRGYDMTAIR